MRKLDFISRSPQLSIFRESSNKNNLGGVLFLIFIIILILLAIVYISDFAMKDINSLIHALKKLMMKIILVKVISKDIKNWKKILISNFLWQKIIQIDL